MELNILIGFEESQEVCKAFRKLGHNAFSCDLKDCSGGHPERHLKMDIYEALTLKKWDLAIIHPPYTAIAVSGNAHYAKGKPRNNQRISAIKWTQELWDYTTSLIPYVALENPVGCLSTMGNFPKPQYIQPYEFGHCESKKTGLWLHNLPKLKETERVIGRFVDGVERFDNQTDSGQNKLAPSEERAEIRSKTYPGIAEAMAGQWSEYIVSDMKPIENL